MKFFSKLFHNKSIVTIISIAVCLVILFFAYRYRVDTAINAIEIPIAAKSLSAREQITEDSIKYVKVASSMITDNVITNKNDLLEQYVNYNTVIPEGSMFYKSAVVTWSQMPDSAWKNISEGNTVVYLSFGSSNSSAYANSIYPGDKIDLFFSGTVASENGRSTKNVFGKLIEGIEVLAVKDSSGKHIFKKTANQKEVSALIFSVSEDYHLLIKKAEKVSGDLIPVPRNVNYDKEINVTSDYIRKLIEDRYHKIPTDFVSDDVNNNITITE